MIRIYIDTNLLEINLAPHPEEERAMMALRDRVLAGEAQIVTSAVITREVDAARDPSVRADLLRNASAVEKIAADERVLGFSNVEGAHGTMVVNPIVSDVQDEGVYGQLRRLGLDQRDAQHVAQAISSGSDVFLTRDEKTILRHATKIEAAFPIKLRKPSVLESELSSGAVT